MFDRGYWKVGSFRGVPIRLHWTLPLGVLVFSGGAFVPAFWLAFTLLILLHEFGHAAFVRRFGHRTIGIDVTGFGGMCRWSGHASPFERSAIAWGGVLAQGVLLTATFAFVLVAGTPTNPHAAEVVNAFTRTNLLLIGLNLLPFPPLDGAEAWKIFRQGRFRNLLDGLRDRARRAKPSAKRQGARKSPGRVIDFQDYAERKRRKQSDDVAHKEGRPDASRQLADELIRIAEESARARKKRNEN
ncbi:MAG: hypothetical protein ACOC1F_03530 [Myxococcota bacterium]